MTGLEKADDEQVKERYEREADTAQSMRDMADLDEKLEEETNEAMIKELRNMRDNMKAQLDIMIPTQTDT